jgi:outer membrane protein assembly factor BamB
MDDTAAARPPARTLSRRAALLLPLLAGGCSWFDTESLFFAPKPKLPGQRVDVEKLGRGLAVDNPRNLKVTLPKPATRADWPQAGGVPSHEMGHAAAGDRLSEAWSVDIGTGGGYRRKITAQPVIAQGHVFTMDADAVVSCFDATSGRRLWDFDTLPEDNRGTNIGGGIAFDAGTLYVSTGRAQALALDPATGKPRWRQDLASAARAAPTVAEGKLFIPLLGEQLVALSAADGKKLWTYQSPDTVTTAVLGLPAPAYADGLLVAGFGSGDLVALRGASGAVVWSDSLAAASGRSSVIDLSAIHGMPVIQNGQVYAVGLGGVLLALDLRSGRRLWERDVASDQTPCIAGDWIFLVSTSSEVAALATIDGSVAWVTQLQPYQNMKKHEDSIHWQGPTLVSDRLIVTASTGIAQAISPYTGAILGKQDLSSPVTVPPSVALNTVYVITVDGSLVALR